jgi:hypothetical protein
MENWISDKLESELDQFYALIYILAGTVLSVASLRNWWDDSTDQYACILAGPNLDAALRVAKFMAHEWKNAQ